jgi:hypothetical protein
MHPSNFSDSDNASEHQAILELDSSFENEPDTQGDEVIHNFLTRVTENVLYCVDAILTRHGSHSEEYNHRLAFNRCNGKYILCVLTAMPDWSRKTYLWYFTMPPITYLGVDHPLEGSWSTFDFDYEGADLARASVAFQESIDVDGFELSSGVDAEGTSIVLLDKRGTQWNVQIDPILGAKD